MSADRVPVLVKTLVDARRSLLLWALGLVVVVSMYLPVYPQLADSGSLTASAGALPEELSSALGMADLATAPGYLGGTVYGLLGPLLLLVFATGFGSRAIGGDEEAGTLDLYLAHPLSRRRLVLERFGALAAAIAAFGLVVWGSVAAYVAGLGLDVGAEGVAAASLALTLLVLGFGTLALAVGAATGRRAAALGVTAGTAVLAYLANALAPLVDGLEDVRRLSPFYHLAGSEPLRTGFDLGGILVLAVIPVALLAAAVATFDRRDLNV